MGVPISGLRGQISVLREKIQELKDLFNRFDTGGAAGGFTDKCLKPFFPRLLSRSTPYPPKLSNGMKNNNHFSAFRFYLSY
jgi:hypothetical protein